MSDEKMVQVAPETKPALPNNTDPDERNPIGKIARLPYKIREQLNRRLRNNEPDSQILPWLEGLPAVKKILAAQFDGKSINHQNLSNWRRGGHKQWLRRQEEVDEIQTQVEDAGDLWNTASERLARGAVTVASARVLKMLRERLPEQCTADELAKLCFAVTALAQTEQSNIRLEYEKTRVRQRNELLVLSWDKHLRDCVATAQRALNDAICKDIQAADIDNGEKIELLGHELFGKKWQGREVAEPTKQTQ